MPTVLVVASDLMFLARIEAAVRAEEGDEAVQAALPDVDGAVIDLHERTLDAIAAVAAAHRAGVPVVAFGRHTEPATLRAAREAGATIVVARSQLVEELPELLRRLIGGRTAADR